MCNKPYLQLEKTITISRLWDFFFFFFAYFKGEMLFVSSTELLRF